MTTVYILYRPENVDYWYQCVLKDIYFLIIQLTAINKFISQPSWSVEGEASLEYGQELETLQERLDVKFYGDLVLPEPPSTLRDAVLLSQEIPSLCEESKSPVTFSIVPISDYCGEAEKILNEITAANVDKERTQVIFFHCSCLNKKERSFKTFGDNASQVSSCYVPGK